MTRIGYISFRVASKILAVRGFAMPLIRREVRIVYRQGFRLLCNLDKSCRILLPITIESYLDFDQHKRDHEDYDE